MTKFVVPLLLIFLISSAAFILVPHGAFHDVKTATQTMCLDHCLSALASITQAPQIILFAFAILLSFFFAASVRLPILNRTRPRYTRFSVPDAQFLFATVLLRE